MTLYTLYRQSAPPLSHQGSSASHSIFTHDEQAYYQLSMKEKAGLMKTPTCTFSTNKLQINTFGGAQLAVQKMLSIYATPKWEKRKGKVITLRLKPSLKPTLLNHYTTVCLLRRLVVIHAEYITHNIIIIMPTHLQAHTHL